MKQRLWFERRFPFPVEVSSAPELLARLRGTPARLEDLVRNTEKTELTKKPDGTWSAQENIGHLLDLEPLWFGRLRDFLEGAEVLRPADLQNRKTHEANHNDVPLDSLLREFRAARGKLVDGLRKLDLTDWQRSAQHPRLKEPMTVADHAFFVAEHDDHHLARIGGLLGVT